MSRISVVPPRLARLLLAAVTDRTDRKFILADLDEELARRQDEIGHVQARRWYRWQARSAIVPGLRRRFSRSLPSRPKTQRSPASDLGSMRGGARRNAANGQPVPENFAGKRSWSELMPDFLGNFYFAFRSLKKSPLVVVIIVLSLGLGIGAVTTAFTITNAMLFRTTVEVSSPATLASIYTRAGESGSHGPTSFPDFLDLEEQAESLAETAAYRLGVVRLGEFGGEGGTRRLAVEIVTGNYFDVLGVPMAMGRSFRADETEIGSAEHVVILSYHLWQDWFNGSPGAMGQSVVLDGQQWTVIGVAPEGMTSRFLGIRVDGWVPLGTPGGVYHATPARLENRTHRDFWVLGRLTDGSSLEQVDAELLVLGDRLHEEYGLEWEDAGGRELTLAAISEEESRLPPEFTAVLSGFSFVLLGATGLVLLIACSNVASLLLARANLRRHEMAVRLALGAARRKLVAMLLAESLLLAFAGCALGVLFARVASHSLSVVRLPVELPLTFDFTMDSRVLGFSVLLSAFACILFGLTPALAGSKPGLMPSLKVDLGMGKKYRRFGLRNLLVIGQVAASLAFVVAAGLLFRSAQEAASVELGFDPTGVAVMSKILPEDRYSPEAGMQYLRDLRTDLAALPDIEEAHLSRSIEGSLFAAISEAEIDVPGYERGQGESMTFSFNSVTPGYLEMLDMELLRGRTFEESDTSGAPLVAVVNESFVERYYPGRDGMGERFTITDRDVDGPSRGKTRTFEVVGTIRDGQFNDMETGQQPYFWTSFYQGYAQIVILSAKSRAGTEAALPALWREVEKAPDETTLVTPTTFQELISFQYAIMRVGSRFLAYGGAFGLALAAIGIYGIVSFAVTQRRREMAIRQVVGAHPAQVFRLVVGDGMRLAVYGLIVGLLFVVPIAILGEVSAFGVGAFDPIAVGGGSLLLLSAALVACIVPARRVTSFDPMETLRDE
jgi:predicted permease